VRRHARLARGIDERPADPFAELTMDETARRSDRSWQLALAILYLGFYAWMLVAGHGMPYVMDANESFSIYWHAYNLFHFNIGDSLGITDESFSPYAAAHPYLYTHQGNFPRLFGFLIYLLGARTIQSQVAVTTAIVGTAAFVLAYRYFARIAEPRFAVIYCALLATDYVLYGQWHVVTDRVWSGFFVFALFSCLHDAGGELRRRALAFLFLIGVGLFYNELAFAGMLSIAGVLYAVMIFWRRPALAASAIASFVAGGLSALTILFAQLSARFGTNVVLTDLFYTFVARNFANDPAGREAVRSFFETHQIAFWPQYVNGDLYRNFKEFIFSLSHYDLQVYTPIFCLVTALVLVGWGLGAGRTGSAMLEPSAERVQNAPSQARSPGQRATDLILLIHLAVALFLVLRPIAIGEGVFALYPASVVRGGVPAGLHVSPGTIVAALAAIAGALSIVKVSTGSWWATTRLSPWAALRLLALLIVTGAALGWQRLLYKGGGGAELADIWMLPLAAPWARTAARLAVATALVVAILMAMGGERALIAGSCRDVFARIGRFVIAGLAGYTVVYWLSPGIVLSGFQWRYAPFVVFFLCAVPACAFYVLVLAAGRLRAVWHEGQAGEAAMSLAAAGLLLAGLTYWVGLQLSYVRLLPPDHGSFFRRLAAPPFRGHSFVSNSYTAPLTAFTDDWAYADTMIGKGGVVLTSKGYVLHRDMRSYLWFADRGRNSAYAFPDFYACFVQQNLASAAARRVAQQHGWQPAGGCSMLPLIAEAGRPGAVLRNEVFARDAPDRDYWAVIRLDSDSPPFVRTIEAAVQADGAGGHRVVYSAAAGQQQGKPLVSPLAELMAVPDDSSCELDPERLVTLAKSEDGAPFSLSPDFTGTLALRYTPRTATRAGQSVLSRPWRVTPAGAEPCPWPAVDYSFAESGSSSTWLLDGWGDPEPWGTWTVGPVARLVPDIHTLPDHGLVLTVMATPFVTPAHPSVEASLQVNDVAVGHLIFALGLPDRPHSVFVPRAALERNMPPEIRLVITDPASPLTLGMSSDERLLGLGLRRMQLAEGAEEPAMLVEPGEDLDFSAGGRAVAALGEGWIAAEPRGSWSIGHAADIRFRLAHTIGGGAVLRIVGAPLLTARRTTASVDLAVNGSAVGSIQYRLGEQESERVVRVPGVALAQSAQSVVSLTLHMSDARSPKELGLSDDPRPLGFFLRQLRLDPVQ